MDVGLVDKQDKDYMENWKIIFNGYICIPDRRCTFRKVIWPRRSAHASALWGSVIKYFGDFRSIMRLDTRWSNLPLLGLKQRECHIWEKWGRKQKEIGKWWKGSKMNRKEMEERKGKDTENWRESKRWAECEKVENKRGKNVTKKNKNCQHQSDSWK